LDFLRLLSPRSAGDQASQDKIQSVTGVLSQYKDLS